MAHTDLQPEVHNTSLRPHDNGFHIVASVHSPIHAASDPVYWTCLAMCFAATHTACDCSLT